MGERNSILFGKLTLRPKRRSVELAASSTSSGRPNSTPNSTSAAEGPTSFSGPADYGLGYSSINHVCSASYRGNRKSRMPHSHAIERPATAEAHAGHEFGRSSTSRSPRRPNKLGSPHADEQPLFVSIVHEALPAPRIQSTVRARCSSTNSARVSSSPPKAVAPLARPQSPFAINSSASQPRFTTIVSERLAVRQPQSADDSDVDQPPRYDVVVDPAGTASVDSLFYAVGRGWKKGIYTTKEEAQRQIRNFPGPLLQHFHDRAEAERFLANAGRFSSQPAKKDDDDWADELAERTRIFAGLDPNSELARRRSTGMSAERREAQRKSRMHFAKHSPILAQDVPLLSPPLSLCSKLSDDLPISPIEDSRASGVGPAPSPFKGMTLLPVKDLASSMAFYIRVLGFSCLSHTEDVQAVMGSSAATVCLRSLRHAPPPTAVSNFSRLSLISTAQNGARIDPLGSGYAVLPPTPEEQPEPTQSWLPPSPESLSHSCTEPGPLKLPATSLSLRSAASAPSGATVLVECSGELEAMHSLLTAKLNEWRLDQAKATHDSFGIAHLSDSARLLGGIQQTPWDAQELHLCDLDGHRIIYTTPLLHTATEASLI
ncbi:hypothetical protein PaG_04834 [Moesziomyces aphidis]|uniref:Ribonuclease H1 N-terminal domain-containing protein n=1 Tax=Moesziomyces aphidis TaxID=84754 RepID=W3VGY4_MOEAP|nr:hypothetical protein PaG_04834 [Moesziomyces aphidis]